MVLFFLNGLQSSSLIQQNCRNSYELAIVRFVIKTLIDRQNRLRFVYTHFKSCYQSLDKTPFDFSNIVRAMQKLYHECKKENDTETSQEFGHMT